MWSSVFVPPSKVIQKTSLTEIRPKKITLCIKVLSHLRCYRCNAAVITLIAPDFITLRGLFGFFLRLQCVCGSATVRSSDASLVNDASSMNWDSEIKFVPQQNDRVASGGRKSLCNMKILLLLWLCSFMEANKKVSRGCEQEVLGLHLCIPVNLSTKHAVHCSHPLPW